MRDYTAKDLHLPKMAFYQAYRQMMKSGDLISWSGTGIISRLIRIYSDRSHVSGVVASPDHEKWRNRVVQIEAWEGEVNARALSRRLGEYDGKAWWHQLRPEFDAYRDDIGACMWDMVGRPYDYGSLFKNALGLVSEDASKFFCSELVGYAVRECIPRIDLERFLPHEDLELLLSGKALRPGGISRLPIYRPAWRLI